MTKKFLVVAAGLAAGMALVAEAAYVTVTCEEPKVIVVPNGNDFNLFAPGFPDTYVTNVIVRAVAGWEFVPAASELKFEMKGGDKKGYSLKKTSDEPTSSGTIYFHNYFIKSSEAGGAKTNVVPSGTSVTYTARKNNKDCKSDWTITGPDNYNKKIDDSKSIIFNRSFWQITSWFIPPFGTGMAGVYEIKAQDADKPAYPAYLKDAGEMKVVGVKRITGAGKMSERMEPPSGGKTWEESEVVYAQPCAYANFIMELEPSLTSNEFERIKGSLSWSVSGSIWGSGRLDETSDPLSTDYSAPSGAGKYTVTAKCGDSKRIILVKVGDPKIHKVSFNGNTPIERDITGIHYTAPDWLDTNLDGISDSLVDPNANPKKPYHPIAYLSTATMSAEGVFKPYCTKESKPNEFIDDYDAFAPVQKLRFSPDNGFFSGWDWSTPTNFIMSGTTVTAAKPFKPAFEVGYESEYELAWEVGFGEAGTTDNNLAWKRSSSEHELYLTYKVAVPSRETVFHVSCTSASGKKTDPTVIDGIWSGFGSGSAPVDVKRKDDVKLTYYDSYLVTNTNFKLLLKETDGQCGAWADFFRETLKIHGIASVHTWIFPTLTNSSGFIVNTWSFTGGTSGNADFPYKNDRPSGGYIRPKDYYFDPVNEVKYTSGKRGQNNPKPASHFNNHQLIYIDVMNACYDPSYGLKHTSRQSIDNTLSGFFQTAGYYVRGLPFITGFYYTNNPPGVQIKLEGYDLTTTPPTYIPVPLL